LLRTVIAANDPEPLQFRAGHVAYHARHRRSEDLAFDKTDEKDAVIIARLAAQLRCYVPEPVDENVGSAGASGRAGSSC
jgi:hypothetical protein